MQVCDTGRITTFHKRTTLSQQSFEAQAKLLMGPVDSYAVTDPNQRSLLEREIDCKAT